MRPLSRLSLTTLFIIFSFSFCLAQAPDWSAAVSAGGTGNDRGVCVAMDDAGNSYVAGYFYEEATFGSITITSSLYKELFVAKMASDGTWLWAVGAGGSNHSGAYSIALDAAGDAYITGEYNGSPSFGEHSLTSYGYTVDIFVAKINSSGIWQWAVSAGGTGDSEKGYDLVLDDAGNIYVTGLFEDTATFGSYSLTSAGYADVFIAKLNNSGTWLSAYGAGGVYNDSGSRIGLDASNNIFITGYYSLTANFGTQQLISLGNNDDFIAKMDPSGSFLWVRSSEGGGASDLVIDAMGDAFIIGGCEGDATFGSITVLGEVFLAKINSAGTWTWAEAPAGLHYGYGSALTQDSDDNIYCTGEFQGEIIFGSNTLQSDLGGATLFAAKLGSNLEWMWATQSAGLGDTGPNSICVNGNHAISITGSFSDDIQVGSQALASAGSSDIFCVTMHDTISFEADFSVNTTSGIAPLTVNFSDLSVGDPTAWAWDFQNDGTVDSDEQSPTFVYAIPGTYSVQMTISDGANTASRTLVDLIAVSLPLPSANFTSDMQNGESPFTVNFSDLSEGSPDTWEWDFENDGTIDSYDQNPQHQYTETGNYSVSLLVSNASGTDAEIKESYIAVAAPNITFTVKQDGSGDYSSIQAAIDGVSDGQIVVVYPGTYMENIDFNGKAILVESLFSSTQDQAYIDQTIINGGQNGNVVRMNSGEGTETELTGFTITNGSSSSSGGGIMMYGVSPTISHCKIMNSVSVNYGGGIACLQNANPYLHHLELSGNTSNEGGGISVYLSNPTLENILVANNTATSTGGGVAFSDCPGLSINHMTITENTAQWGGGMFITSSHVSVNNSILWNNTPEQIYFNYYFDPNEVDIAYSDIGGGADGIVVQNGTLNMESGNLAAYPFFGDGFRLRPISPCIDAGDPATALDPDNTRADMGAFYFDPNYVSIHSELDPIDSFVLNQNFPNPFNPSTTIRYGLPEHSMVSIVIYDVGGKVVRTFQPKSKSAGWHEQVWNGVDDTGAVIGTGIYFARLISGYDTQNIKMLFLK